MNLHEFYIGKAFDAYEYFGAHITKDGVLFRVYAPCAEKIELIGEFNDWDGSEDEMIQDAQSGVFECVQEDAEPGMMYKYRIYQKDGIVLDRFDPYSFGSQVRPDTASIIVDLDQYHFSDSAWIKKRCKNYDFPVNIYEVHAGSWRKNEADEENGWYHYNELARQLIPYIKEMGYTHVEFLPLTEHPADCSWGYQASGYFCPTSRYGTAGELMEMVDLFHKEGIGVIMDVVFNHTYRRDDSNLQKIVPGYYYRSDETGYTNGSGCGNEVASDRPMVQKLIVDSLIYWAKEYHIDGFRFDLMGVLDIDTMNVIAERLKEIRPDIYLYGEGWNGGPSSLAEEKRAFKASAKKMPGIGMFNDDIRDTIKGSVFYDDHLGFVNGGTHLENALRYGITGAVAHPQVDYDAYGSKPWAKEPGQSINYVSCHDNYTLWDKLSVSCPEASEEKKKAMNRLCAAIVFTSQGVPFIQAGEEFLRSKPLPEKKGFAENSYNMPDAVNSIKWDNIHEYPDMIAYYKGLMALRKAHPVFRMQSEAEMTQNLCFLSDTPENVVAYLLKGKGADDTPENILVIFNGNDEEILYNLPEGKWKILVDDKTAGADGKKNISEKADVEPLSALVLEKE